MKKLLLIAMLLIIPATLAVYCDEQPVSTCECRTNIEYGFFGIPTQWTDVPNILPATDWFNLYCSSPGFIKQQRTVFQITKPDCTQRFETKEYRETEENICLKCPKPKLIGGWMPEQCAGSQTIYTRDVIAYYFTPDVEECDLGSFMEIKAEPEGICSAPGGEILMAITQNWYMVIAAFATAVVSIILYFKKIRRR